MKDFAIISSYYIDKWDDDKVGNYYCVKSIKSLSAK